MAKKKKTGAARGSRDGGGSPATMTMTTTTKTKNAYECAAGGANNKLEKMAGWLTSGLYAAFFVSMDTCACVKLDTLEEPILLRRPFLLPHSPTPPRTVLPPPFNNRVLHHSDAHPLPNSTKAHPPHSHPAEN